MSGHAERLKYALALLSSMEWNDVARHRDTCPVCGFPKSYQRHEPGCSLEAVLTGKDPVRLKDLEARYGDPAFGYDGRDRARHATTVLWPEGLEPVLTDAGPAINNAQTEADRPESVTQDPGLSPGHDEKGT